jgi:general secretion pathway protein A
VQIEAMGHWKGYGPDNAVRTDVGVTDGTSSQDLASSVLTYEPYYGLKKKPFSLSTDPRALYKSSSHASVFEDLLAAIRRREGLIVLTGEMGSGKTTLCRAALYQLDRKTFTTFVPDPYLSREDLLRMLLVGFGEVSVHDLKQGRLKGTPRADLGVQLFEFLTSLESVDAFAALVIDEAQNLSGPLLDEIRALSEMEAGRRLLQIVLVGQPELRSRLKRPEMRQIAQRVTTICDLRPLTLDGVAGYVSHRLALAGGTPDRVQFSPAALDLVFTGSMGVPRLVNRICDRALFHAFVDRTSQAGQIHVGRALQELELVPARPEPLIIDPMPAPVVPLSSDATPAPAVALEPAASSTVTTAGGLFVKTTSEETPSSGIDLRALLELPPVTRQIKETAAPPRQRPSPLGHPSSRRRLWWRHALSSLSLPALGMGVMILTGGAAVTTVGKGSLGVESPPLPKSPAVMPAVGLTNGSNPAPMAQPVVTAAAAANIAADQTWVVQVAAFSNPDRSVAMVQRLAEIGLPAYQVEPDTATDGLTLVRVGPYRSAEEADHARNRLRAVPDYEGAFVRNITRTKN